MNTTGTVVGGYAWILPALITVVWCLSWRGSARLRWGLLAVSGVVSALLFGTGYLIPVAPGPPPVCSSQFACDPAAGVFWIVVGVYGFAWFLVLLIVTCAIGLVRATIRAR